VVCEVRQLPFGANRLNSAWALVKQCPQARVRTAFLGSEVQVQRDRIEAGKKSPREIGDGQLEDGRSDELGEAGRHTGVARGCRGETEAGTSDRHLEGLIAKSITKVVNFIDDDEVDATPELIHVPVRALEGGDRQRRSPPHAIAIAADRTPVVRPDLPEPLIEQDPRRHQAQGAEACAAHGGESQPGLTAPRGESDDAAAMPQLPRRQRGLLIGSEFDVRPQVLRRR
jgi:hypothetical protein